MSVPLMCVNYTAVLLRNLLHSRDNIFTLINVSLFFLMMHHQCSRKCQISITEEMEKQKCTNECHLIYVLLLNSKSPLWFLPEGTMLAPYHCQTLSQTECKTPFYLLNYVSSFAVGWRRPFSRLGGAPERHPDVMAPYHRQALPHTAV